MVTGATVVGARVVGTLVGVCDGVAVVGGCVGDGVGHPLAVVVYAMRHAATMSSGLHALSALSFRHVELPSVVLMHHSASSQYMYLARQTVRG